MEAMDYPKITVLNILTTFFPKECIEGNSTMIISKVIP
jgi:hypothetical protein